MNRSGDQFFSRAALARDQNRGFRRGDPRHLLVQPLHRFAFPEQIPEMLFIGGLLVEQMNLLGQVFVARSREPSSARRTRSQPAW